ncbi:predicted protein [Sclerotinia sclerotiorum 1980 UF-70]|nr:predicted protein [Sclerotinia sclerotiorum 1980 UF-70]EDO01166.1 predicted protein [Sclerotinia sclerotiorum 1980 UF-70]
MFHEAKLDSASAAEITLCEKQVYNACAAFLDYFPERDSVFALTTWGTKGRLWVVNRGTKHLIPRFLGPEVFSAHYIEASSTAAMYLKKSLRSLHNWKDSSSDTKARDRARTEGGETEGEWPEGEWPGGGWLEGARSIGARSEGAGPEGVEPGGAGPCRPATSYQGQGSRESTVDYSQKTNSSVGQVAPAFVGTWYYEEKKNHVYYKFRIPDSGKEIKTKASQWKAAYQEGIPCLMYTREETGRQYYVWELGATKAPITRGYR